MVEIILDIDETELKHLSHTSCSGDILQSQPDRFETDTTNVSRGRHGTEDPTIQVILIRVTDLGGNQDIGTMHWCNNWVEAKLLKAYLNDQGHYAHIMWDLADGYDYCVWTSDPYVFGAQSVQNSTNPVDYTAPFEEE